VIFGVVTRVYAVKKDNFVRQYGKNRHITPNISEYPRPIFSYFTGLVGVWVGMVIPIFVRQSSKKRCYGNQLNFGALRRRRQERPLLFAPASNNGYDDRAVAFKRLNGNKLASVQIW